MRNPVAVGAAALLVVAVLVVVTFHIADLASVLTSHSYQAAFGEAAGLSSGDDVRIAGVQVGRVTAVALDRDQVRVDFRVDRDTSLGSATRASIRIGTVFGQKYLALVPGGTGRLTRIPVEHTSSPYDLAEAVTGLGETLGAIDPAQLAAAFGALSDAFATTPAAVQGSVRGLSKLSAAIAARDSQLRQLLARSRSVSGVLAGRDADFAQLVTDGTLLLREVTARKDALTGLLTSTNALGTQLAAMIGENRAQLAPALAGVRRVVQLLQHNQGALESSLKLLGPYVRAFTDASGNGPWIDTYVDGLLPGLGSAR
ncbi:MAG: phospholipid/cholesterol/gamma-HCH transport system substrate-binding protein [Cryptosporangiaceae bacterium]|nr:phospholipid/cholesterol/gamma-HCH transport system substrate-binding protein [Cryptosporangiaceae bacterium]